MQVIEKLKNSVIVSVQAAKGEPLYEENVLKAMVQSVVNGGAQGLRLAGERDIKNARKMFPELPIIGITKPEKIPENFEELVYITPTCQDARLVANAGADIIAVDGTLRDRPGGEHLLDVIKCIKCSGKLAMADIATYQEGQDARKLGADIISTTLSGYTTNSKKGLIGPDFELLKRLTDTLDCPIILEGRIWDPSDIKKAFELGAHAVVVGSAITRPHEITKRFLGY